MSLRSPRFSLIILKTRPWSAQAGLRLHWGSGRWFVERSQASGHGTVGSEEAWVQFS